MAHAILRFARRHPSCQHIDVSPYTLPHALYSGRLLGIGNVSRLAMMMLWLFVFLVPWENVVVIPGLGLGAKLWGLATGVIGLSAVLLEGGVRFHPFLLAGLLFVAWGWASVLWSMEPKLSGERMLTYAGPLAYDLLGLPLWSSFSYVSSICLWAWVAVLATIRAYMQGIEMWFMGASQHG